MKKKILGIFASLLFLAMLATPAFAKPTKGQKAAITLDFTRTSKTLLEPNRITGSVTHSHYLVTWDVTLEFENGTILEGEADNERYEVTVPQKDGANKVVRGYYEFTFPGGGFEGRELLILEGFVSGTWEKSKVYALFHGTGGFEGQTINVGHTWGAPGSAPAEWTGYWLKP